MMYGLMRDSAVIGVAKRAARPTRRATRRAGRGRQQMSGFEIMSEVVNAVRVWWASIPTEERR